MTRAMPRRSGRSPASGRCTATRSPARSPPVGLPALRDRRVGRGSSGASHDADVSTPRRCESSAVARHCRAATARRASPTGCASVLRRTHDPGRVLGVHEDPLPDLQVHEEPEAQTVLPGPRAVFISEAPEGRLLSTIRRASDPPPPPLAALFPARQGVAHDGVFKLVQWHYGRSVSATNWPDWGWMLPGSTWTRMVPAARDTRSVESVRTTWLRSRGPAGRTSNQRSRRARRSRTAPPVIIR